MCEPEVSGLKLWVANELWVDATLQTWSNYIVVAVCNCSILLPLWSNGQYIWVCVDMPVDSSLPLRVLVYCQASTIISAILLVLHRCKMALPTSCWPSLSFWLCTPDIEGVTVLQAAEGPFAISCIICSIWIMKPCLEWWTQLTS